MASEKIRLDQYCARKGLSASREKARREIIAGWVQVNGETVREPSRRIESSATVTVRRPGGLFVSRGGEKIKRALDYFDIDVTGKVVADLGASTGGFTDCLLKRGAAKVYAVDVGYGQLDYSLQRDDRVVVMDRTNARDLSGEMFNEKIDFITADLSFISIIKVLEPLKSVFPCIRGVFLLKPQFEAGPGEQKKGVVRKKENHRAILNRVLGRLIEDGLVIHGLTWSPVKGPAGNIEFLVYFSSAPVKETMPEGISPEGIVVLVEEAVEEAHRELNPLSRGEAQ